MAGQPMSSSARTRVLGWAAAAIGIASVSAAAVWARVASYPMWLPRPLPALLEWFVEPGVLVWWLTLGGVFQGYPVDRAGYAMIVAGNTAVWLIVAAASAWVIRWIAGKRTDRTRSCACGRRQSGAQISHGVLDKPARRP